MEALQHVWALGHATVADVHSQILASRDVAYTTVLSVLGKLARKGYLSTEKDGVAYVYSAARSPDEVRGDLLQGLIDTVFSGSTPALVQTLVGREALTPEQAESLERLVEVVREQSGGREPEGA